MFPGFQNFTVRSAGDLLADLNSCRQLRHLTELQRASIVTDSFAARRPRTTFVWVAEAFALAMTRYGYSCDICAEVVIFNADHARKAADRALDNLDGYLKLMLCQKCGGKYINFAKREYDREARMTYCPDLEKIMLAFIAFEIIRMHGRVKRGEPPLGK